MEFILIHIGTAPKDTNDEEDGNAQESDDFDSEEEGETGVIEKTFKFDDFVKRLVNPKVVRACTIVLSDWEKIPTKSLKAAVTILHRIAYGSHCPAMLYQAILFRIFQKVLDAPREQHQEELRRLAIYVIKKFVEIAPTNPKIYSELLFYKTIREANELETGYCDNYDAGTKGTWTDEQEDELRMLYQENQNNPETDQDVIDWILDNLIDKTRTRRGILKKLKEMGLIFKAPTKKSSAGFNKNQWQYEEDEQLRQLYDEHRLDEKCLYKIVEILGDKRSQNAIVKRMLELHLIADKSEILPSKRGKKSIKSHHQRANTSSDESDSDSWLTSRNQLHQNLRKIKKKIVRKVIRHPLDVETLKKNISELDEKFKLAINWLIESLQEATDDTETELNEESSDDGIPLFPINETQIYAVENENFQKILTTLNLICPKEEVSTYWRIPSTFKAADLKLRIKALKGESIEEDDIVHDEIIEYESDDEIQPKKQQKAAKKNQGRILDKLLKKPKKSKTRKIKQNPLDIPTVRGLLFQIDDQFREAIGWLAESLIDAADDTEEANNEEDGIPILPMLEIQKNAMEDDNFKKLLIALGIQPPIQEIETYWRIPVYLKANDLKKRSQILRGEEVDGEADEAEIESQEEDENNYSTNNEDDSDAGDDFFDKYVKDRHDKMQSLVYNASDNEDEIRKPLKRKQVKKIKVEKKSSNKKDEDKPSKAKKSSKEIIEKKPKNDKSTKKGNFNLNDMVLSGSENPLDSNYDDLDFDSENLRLRLAELSDGSDDENQVKTATISRTKKKVFLIESDDEDEIIGNTTLNDSKLNKQFDQPSTSTNIHPRRHRNIIIDSDSDDSENKEIQNKKSIDSIIINNNDDDDDNDDVYNGDGQPKDKNVLQNEKFPNSYQIDLIKDTNLEPNNQRDDKIESINQYHISNNTTKTNDDNDDENKIIKITKDVEIIASTKRNIESSNKITIDIDNNSFTHATTHGYKSSSIVSIPDRNIMSSISRIGDDGIDCLTEPTITPTIPSGTENLKLNKKHEQQSNNDDNNIDSIDAIDTTSHTSNIDEIIMVEKRKLKNDLSSDDEDDIIVKRRKIENRNDDAGDEGNAGINEDDNNIVNQPLRRRIAPIIDDDDDDDDNE